jgi:molybdopterin/thiamine biosynthesis adenylyltransferase
MGLSENWRGLRLAFVAACRGNGADPILCSDLVTPVLTATSTELSASYQGQPVLVEEYDESEYHSRFRGLTITERLAGAAVAVVGCGTIGWKAATELAKHGIKLLIFDPDTVSVENWYRLNQGGFGALSIGRNKGHALRDLVLSDVPTADIEVHAIDVCREQARFRDALALTRPNLVVISTDTRDSVRITNAITRKLAIPVLQITLSAGAESGQLFYTAQRPTDPCLLCIEQSGVTSDLRDSRQQYAEEASAAQHAVPALSVDTTIVAAIGTKIAMAYLAGEDIRRYFTNGGTSGDIMWCSTTPDTWILEDFAQKLVAIVEKQPHCRGCWTPTADDIRNKHAKRKESRNEQSKV